jgi:hypothetical protein
MGKEHQKVDYALLRIKSGKRCKKYQQTRKVNPAKGSPFAKQSGVRQINILKIIKLAFTISDQMITVKAVCKMKRFVWL